MKNIMTAVLALAVLGANGVDYTWTGDGDGASWSDAANWTGGDSGGYPAGGDKAIFESSVDIVTPVTVADGTELEISIAKSCTNIFAGGLSGSGDLIFSGAGYVSFPVNSGSSYSGDVKFTSSCRAYLANAKGLGSGKLTFQDKSALWVTNSMTVANDIHIDRAGGAVGIGAYKYATLVFHCPNDGATLTYSGKITASMDFPFSMEQGGNGQTVNFTGGIEGPTLSDGKFYKFTIVLNPAISGTKNKICFKGVLNAPAWDLTCGHSQGNFEFHKSGNAFRYLNFDRQTITFVASDSMPHDGYLYYNGDYTINTIWTGNGTVQTCRGFIDPLNKGPRSMTIHNVNSKTSTLIFNGDNDQYAYAKFRGPIDLIWNPVDDYVLQLPAAGYSNTSDMTGILTASNGTLQITKSFSNVTGICARANGKVEICENVALSKVAAFELSGSGVIEYKSDAVLSKLVRVKMEDSSTLKIGSSSVIATDIAFDLSSDCKFEILDGSHVIWAPSITVDGEKLPSGVYVGKSGVASTSYLPQIGENITIMVYDADSAVVEPVEAVWDAGGGDDTRFSAAANWVGDTLPAFANGDIAPVITAGSGAATIDSAVTLGGLTYGPATDYTGFEINAEGSGHASFATGAELTIATNLVFAEDLGVTFNGDAQIHISPKSKLEIHGTIDDSNLGEILVDGGGLLHLYGDNTFNSKLVLTNGGIHAWSDNAFGSPYGETVIIPRRQSTFYTSNDCSSITFHGITTSETFRWMNTGTVSYGLYFPSGTTNVLKGTFFKEGASTYFAMYANTRIVLEGGIIQTMNNIDFKGIGISYTSTKDTRPELVITNKPLVNKGNEFRFDYVKMRLLAKDNVLKKLNIKEGCHVHVETDDAFDETSTFVKPTLGTSYLSNDFLSPKVFLNGHDIRIASFPTTTPNYLTGTIYTYAAITTDVPATVTLCGAASVTNNFAFNGPVGLTQAGTGTFAFFREHTSTNVLAATEDGKINILPGGSWAGPLSLSGNGTIVLPDTEAVSADKPVIYAEGDSWNLVLPENQTLKVRNLFIDGVEMPGGIYGATELGADRELANITGGVVDVLNRCMIITIK